jgi:regulatory protein YycH of two-component signal transduction system YycFG
VTSKSAETIKKIIEDLTGQKIPFAKDIPASAIATLTSKNSKGLGYSQFNELLLYLGYDRVTHPFFQYLANQTTEYKTGASIRSIAALRKGTDEFRKIAILFFGNVKFAFKKLSRDASFLNEHLARFSQRREESFKARHEQVLPRE